MGFSKFIFKFLAILIILISNISKNIYESIAIGRYCFILKIIGNLFLTKSYLINNLNIAL